MSVAVVRDARTVMVRYSYGQTGYMVVGMSVEALSSESYELFQRRRVWTPARLNDGSQVPYALGWSLPRIGAHRAVGHEGGGCAWASHLPDRRLSVIALCNLAGARADRMADDLALALA